MLLKFRHLPATPGPRHNAGALVIGPDNNLYLPIGDVDGTYQGEEFETLTQNFPDGVEPDGQGKIFRIVPGDVEASTLTTNR